MPRSGLRARRETEDAEDTEFGCTEEWKAGHPEQGCKGQAASREAAVGGSPKGGSQISRCLSSCCFGECGFDPFSFLFFVICDLNCLFSA